MRFTILAALIGLSASLSSFAAGSEKFKSGNFAEARRHFEEHRRLHPDHAPTAAILAKLDELGVTSDGGPAPEASYKERRVRISSDVVITTLTADAGLQGLGDGSGQSVWTSSLALLDWLDQSSRAEWMVHGRRVLELGAGTGVVSLGLVALGVKQAYMTDLPQCVPLLKANADANSELALARGCEVKIGALPWGQTQGSIFDEPHDLIVASDVAYDDELMAPLAATLSSLLLGTEQPEALLALTNVASAGGEPCYQCLFQALKSCGDFDITRIVTIDPQSTVQKHAGELRFEDGERSHTVEIFSIRVSPAGAASKDTT